MPAMRDNGFMSQPLGYVYVLAIRSGYRCRWRNQYNPCVAFAHAGVRMTEFIGTHQSDTHQKALRINLDPRWYGTIAEIGAGQVDDGGGGAAGCWRVAHDVRGRGVRHGREGSLYGNLQLRPQD